MIAGNLSGMKPATMPSYDLLMNPILRALRTLGGSGSIQEIYDKVVDQERLPDDLLELVHDQNKSNQT